MIMTYLRPPISPGVALFDFHALSGPGGWQPAGEGCRVDPLSPDTTKTYEKAIERRAQNALDSSGLIRNDLECSGMAESAGAAGE